MRTGHGIVCFVAVGLAAMACRPSKKACPSGQVQEGSACVVQLSCAAGTSACGSVCCAADQSCVSASLCRGRPCSGTDPCTAGAVCRDGYCLTSDPSCTYKPPPGPFAPRVAWRWEGSQNQPEYRDVLMTPVVIPIAKLEGDRFAPPAVVFNSIRGDMGAGEEVPGVMRAVRGDDGSELWTSDPAHLVNGLSGIAAGDLLGTGEMVFVTGRYSSFDPTKDGIVAFGSDGRFLWELVGPRVRWGAPSIANLTGGKEANVVLGATVIDAHGRLVCQGAFGQGSNFMGPISTVADVDLDGVPEIVTGNTVYGADCQPKPGWPARQPDGRLWDDGLVAVADFTGDAHPEIVVVAAGTVRMHDWQGNVIWGPVSLPGGGSGGAPTVADFDGDGKLEIGVASSSTYSVFKPFASSPVLWTRPTQDHSDVTGSSVFDFMNDGHSEVVYGDECYTHVYDGHDGTELFTAQNPSCTTHENPVIADVNRDGRAEIVVATNSVCGYICPWGPQYGSGHGITVWKDANDRWVSTRAIWNQHAYHVTNVEDDGKIPFPEPDHWTVPALNAFRKNPMGDTSYAAPDLTAESADVSTDRTGCPGVLAITVRVWNRGAVPVAEGVPVAFFSDPGGRLYGVVQTRTRILPAAYEDVTLRLANPPLAPTGVAIRIDDDGTGKGVVGECSKANNAVSALDAFCTAAAL